MFFFNQIICYLKVGFGTNFKCLFHVRDVAAIEYSINLFHPRLSRRWVEGLKWQQSLLQGLISDELKLS